MGLIVEPYLAQQARWPASGRHILAQFDAETIIVYQAYRPAIGHFAVKNGYFGGEFSLSRMSWIKTNFLWMMYRSGWASKEGQEVILAIRLKRSAFDTMLAQAVHSTYEAKIYANPDLWQKAVKESLVRCQWDPDHDPVGKKLERRAIQLGLRGEVLADYAHTWIVEIGDISSFVQEQYKHVQTHTYDQLMTPKEQVYPIDTVLNERLGIA